MPDRTSHPAGAFSYAELSTSDPEAARAFYTRLFGWAWHESPMPMGGTYLMAGKRGRTTAAAYSGRPDEGPPHWNAYVTVASADEAAERAAGLGGTVVAAPFDVMESGRMAIVQDPGGAFIQVWEPRKDIGAEVVNEHGALTWNELTTREPEKCEAFYRDLFNWEFARLPEAPMPMWTIALGGRGNGHMRQMGPQEEGMPSSWASYFGVDSVEDAVTAAEAGGGSALMAPIDVPNGGRFTYLRDPQGAIFGVFAGTFDD